MWDIWPLNVSLITLSLSMVFFALAAWLMSETCVVIGAMCLAATMIVLVIGMIWAAFF